MALKPQKYARKRSRDGLVARSRPLTRQIAVVSTSSGYGHFSWLQRCKTLKTKRFPAVLRLVSRKIDSYHFDPVYEFMT
ncbi:hypothetical protein MnTg02_03400 [bacterium MnTg02]|nr:hypothetical protein MnTg02_03400 [bacterium MnTg02]